MLPSPKKGILCQFYLQSASVEYANIKVMIQEGHSPTGWLTFRDPVDLLSADRPENVLPVLEAIEKAVNTGLHAAGFVSYEAAPGLDSAFTTHCLSHLPLVWFGLFRHAEDAKPLQHPSAASFTLGDFQPSVTAHEYGESISRIKQYLEKGDTYQVNYTFRLRAPFEGDPFHLFSHLCRTQHAEYCAFIDAGDFALCSASPELFFSLNGNELVSRPMKGTSKRGLTFEQDRAFANTLRQSEKERAENVMIVDMVRNDMGRIAKPGTVLVPHLFDIERYPTVLQMTSTVTCTTLASFVDIFNALFPCASITGAPKIRTMQIIRKLEGEPRGVYTGCIGYLSPERRARFNVAIRTVTVVKSDGIAEYGVGGGIVWDSNTRNEYEECRIKARILVTEAREFELLESLLYEGGKGYFLLDQHMERLMRSAEYFGFTVELESARRHLIQEEKSFGTMDHKIRLRVSRAGEIFIDAVKLPNDPVPAPFRLAFATNPINSEDPFLYHKTTNRTVYEKARASVQGVDDVLLWNERAEVTESTIANIVIERAGELVTPRVESGLLPGVFREWLLERGEIREDIVSIEEVKNAEKVYLINSVRRWIPVGKIEWGEAKSAIC